MDLVLDFGNSYKKFALFDGDQIIALESVHTGYENIQTFTESFLQKIPSGKPDKTILASVVDYPESFDKYLISKSRFFKLNQNMPFPVQLDYNSPETLGKDRISVSSASHVLFPGHNVLAIVAGSCITYDFTDASGTYRGGAISPGVNMRFRSLNNFTAHLPLLKGKSKVELTGKDTEKSILSGVMIGIRTEIDGVIDQYRSIYENLTVLLSGGNLNYFDKSLKNNIFAIPNLVLKGLKIILDFNENRKSN